MRVWVVYQVNNANMGTVPVGFYYAFTTCSDKPSGAGNEVNVKCFLLNQLILDKPDELFQGITYTSLYLKWRHWPRPVYILPTRRFSEEGQCFCRHLLQILHSKNTLRM